MGRSESHGTNTHGRVKTHADGGIMLLSATISKDQIEYIRECILFHYDMNSDIKEHIMDINAQCLKSLRAYDS